MDFTSTFSQRFYIQSGDYATTAANATTTFLSYVHTFFGPSELTISAPEDKTTTFNYKFLEDQTK